MSTALAFRDFSLVTWLSFGVISIAAARIGPYFPKIGLPLITGYLFVGAFCGPYVLGNVSLRDVARLSPITQFALAFIAFSAGAELYLPELRSLFKRIFAMTTLIAVITFALVASLVYAFSSTALLPILNKYEPDCRASVASIVAAIMIARSPASAIAVIKEMRSKGPFTSTSLGVTVLCDVYVLLAFTLTTSIAESSCREEHEAGFNSIAMVILVATITASLGIGWVVGKLLLLLMHFKRIPLRYLILPLGSLIFMACQALVDYTHDNSMYVVNLEPLLICIMGGFVCTNQSSHRLRFIKVLQLCGPYVFLPFFVLTGASLDLTVLLGALGFALIVCSIRALCIFMGSGAGGVLTATPPQHSLYMWCTLITQAGVSLGLASEVGMSFPGWGRAIQTSIIACVLINQLIGPMLFKFALKKVGEAGADKGVGDEFDEDAVILDCIVVGPPSMSTMAAAARLMQEGWKVTFAVDNAQEAAAARELLEEWGVSLRSGSSSSGHGHGSDSGAAAGSSSSSSGKAGGAEEVHHVVRKLEEYVSVVVIGSSGEGGGSLWQGTTLPAALAALAAGLAEEQASALPLLAAAASPTWAKLTALMAATPALTSVLLALPPGGEQDITTLLLATQLTLAMRAPTAPKRMQRARLLATATLPAFSALLARRLGCVPFVEAPTAVAALSRLIAAPSGSPLALFPLGATPGDMAGAVHSGCSDGPGYAWLWEREAGSRDAARAAAEAFPSAQVAALGEAIAARLGALESKQSAARAAEVAAAGGAAAAGSEEGSSSSSSAGGAGVAGGRREDPEAVIHVGLVGSELEGSSGGRDEYIDALAGSLKEDVTVARGGKVETKDRVEMYGSIELNRGRS